MEIQWRGLVNNDALSALHGEGFASSVATVDWAAQLDAHSLGWLIASDDGELVGFVNVPWDGRAHAWIQDVVVAEPHRRRGVASRLVKEATARARAAGCSWLHVDFAAEHSSLYIDSCGFSSTTAGLIEL